MGIGNFPIKGGKISNQPIDNGGPAFARTGADGHTSPQIGMSIRDYFAAAALQGMLSDNRINDSFENLSDVSYKCADAMLKARGETK